MLSHGDKTIGFVDPSFEGADGVFPLLKLREIPQEAQRPPKSPTGIVQTFGAERYADGRDRHLFSGRFRNEFKLDLAGRTRACAAVIESVTGPIQTLGMYDC
jgi:hypothetical protein